ncbi:MAG: ABC transporter substrate-binding protein, partial [bacterium]|nr:ABC transporter substrate-binding protein [bacterium]
MKYLKTTNTQTLLTLLTLLTLSTLFLSFGFGAAKMPPQEIKIGAILPLTGPSALLGELARNGLTLAEEDINSKGGIRGNRLKIIYEDGMADPNSSISAFRKLVTFDKVKFVVTTHSNVGLALAPMADKEKVILFVHASHPQITGKSPYVFRHSNTAEQESQIIVDFVSKQNKKNYALAVMDDDYGMIFREKLNKLFPEYKISMIKGSCEIAHFKKKQLLRN